MEEIWGNEKDDDEEEFLPQKEERPQVEEEEPCTCPRCTDWGGCGLWEGCGVQGVNASYGCRYCRHVNSYGPHGCPQCKL